MFLGVIVSTGVTLSIDGTPVIAPMRPGEYHNIPRGDHRLVKNGFSQDTHVSSSQPHAMGPMTPQPAHEPALPANVCQHSDTPYSGVKVTRPSTLKAIGPDSEKDHVAVAA